MATPTYDLLDSVILSSSASSVTFSSISQDYRDLIVVMAAAADDDSTTRYLRMTFNTDTTLTNYSNVAMAGNGASVYGSTFQDGIAPMYYSDINTTIGNSLVLMQIMDYAKTDRHKTVLSRSNSTKTSRGTTATCSRWLNSSAIDQIVLSISGSTWKTGSTYYLYGVAA